MKPAYVVASLSTALLAAGPALAVELVSTDTFTASIGGGVRAGYTVHDEADELTHGPEIRLARIGAEVVYESFGSAEIVLDGGRGTMTLLDAQADLHLSECLTWRFGRYKMAISPDYLASSFGYFYSSRMLTTTLVPGRLQGSSLIFRRDMWGDGAIEVDAGIFQVPGDEGPLEDDLWVGGRVAVTPFRGLELHVGAGHQIERANEENTFGEALNFAATYDRNGVRVATEAVVRLDALDDGEVRPWSVGAIGAYTVGTGAPFDVVPQLGADTLRGADEVYTHRGRGGVLLKWREAPVSIGLEGTVSATDGELAETGFLYGQVKL